MSTIATEPAAETGTRELLRALTAAMRILSAEGNQTAALRESFEHAAQGFRAREALLVRVACQQPLELEPIHHIGKLDADQIEACLSLRSVRGSGVSPSVIREAIHSLEPRLIPDSRDLEQTASQSVSLAAAPHSVMASVVTDPWAHRPLAVLYFQALVHQRTYTAEDLRFLEAYTTALSQAFGLFRSTERRVSEELKKASRKGGGRIPRLIGESPQMTRLKMRLHNVLLPATTRPRPSPILILGPTGSGKGALAAFLHYHSPTRHKNPFVTLNCSKLSGALAEAKLFGHVKGAFTDAKADAPGLFRQAHGGTLFLDEIGVIPEDGQKLLLDVIESRKVRPVGGQTEHDVDVQLVLATNEDLESAVAAGSFRADLYHRIKVLPVRLAPLSERRNDIGPLLMHFFEEEQERQEKRTLGLTPHASAMLLRYDWPGNVRELENAVVALVANGEEGRLIDSKLVREVLPEIAGAPASPEATPTPAVGFRQAQEAWERAYLLEQLQLNNWNIARTARATGLERTVIYRYLRRFGIVIAKKQQAQAEVEGAAGDGEGATA